MDINSKKRCLHDNFLNILKISLEMETASENYPDMWCNKTISFKYEVVLMIYV